MKVQIAEIERRHEGWSKFLVATVRFPDGEMLRREIEDHGDAVGVLPYDPVRRTAILIRQFRAPIFFASREEELLEAVAGIVEPGEQPDDCARRETFEEAGVRLGALEYLAGAWSMPGISTERMTLYLAPYGPDDRVAAGGGVDHDEKITVVELPLGELAAMTDGGRLTDMKAFALVQTLRLRRPELFA
jgi:nudix-type nucleoside diphosphatase (YffH/AdpP family)